MANETQINPKLQSNATVINDSLNHSSSATVINPALDESKVVVGSTLAGKYHVVEKLDLVSGEADLYLVEYNNKQYVAKVYRRERSVKEEIIDTLKHIDSPYVATCFDTGTIDNHIFEIIPYYSKGSLQGKKLSFEQLRDIVIPSLNEGLAVLHNNNIVHKDLKPSNIMINDDMNSVAIIDFGISSVVDSGATVVVTNTGMTPIYSAPETYRGLFLRISDYYSLGITLFELFTGRLPYEGMTQEEMEQMTTVSRIPLPNDMPRDLKELILGLTYGDITNRNNKNNPNRRWEYEEVSNWLQGIKQVIPGEGVSDNNIIPYTFMNESYTSIPSLVRSMAKNWEEGKKHVFRGLLTRHFSKFNPTAAKACQAAEQKASVTSGADDIIYWELLYKLDTNTKEFHWKGKSFMNLPAFGRYILEELNSNNGSIYSYLDGMMRNSVVSRFCEKFDPNNLERLEAVRTLENYYSGQKNDRIKKVQLYRLGYALSGQAILKVDGMEIYTVDELVQYMKDLSKYVEASLDHFKQVTKELMYSDKNLAPQFEAWLIRNGQTDAISKWRESFRIVEEEL